MVVWFNRTTKKKPPKNTISSWIKATVKEAYLWSASRTDQPPAIMAPNLAVMATDEAAYAGPQAIQGQEGRASH